MAKPTVDNWVEPVIVPVAGWPSVQMGSPHQYCRRMGVALAAWQLHLGKR